MTINSILVSLEEVKTLLVKSQILDFENTSRPRNISNTKLSADFLSVMFSDDYDVIYKTAMKNRDFDFVLFDGSFLQFSVTNCTSGLDNGIIRYAYFPNPRNHQTYCEFLMDNDTTYEEAGDIFAEEYEQYVSEAKLKNIVTPIRYDYDYGAYQKDPHHPVSHLHIGLEENVRIPISKILTPQAFLLIVIRNMYYDHWKRAQSDDTFPLIVERAKQQCPDLGQDRFTDFEKKQPYIC